LQFRDEYLSLPPLATELARVLGGFENGLAPIRWFHSMRRIGRRLWRGKRTMQAATRTSLFKGS
jgi:hypothetical protein